MKNTYNVEAFDKEGDRIRKELDYSKSDCVAIAEYWLIDPSLIKDDLDTIQILKVDSNDNEVVVKDYFYKG
jgi:hypothetical protein